MSQMAALVWGPSEVRLGIITYDCRHLKTEQVALGLAQRGGFDMTFFALPFVTRATRTILFAHRPEMNSGAHSREIAAAVGADFRPIPDPDAIAADAADYFLILGAGLLPASFVSATSGRVLNAHPGLIPLVRGLDAFKWAIHDGMPVGNSLHMIDEEADAGTLVGLSSTPVFHTDSLHSFARRHYELEIAMMIDFDHYLRSPTLEPAGATRPARMRMPADKQAELESRFEDYRRRFAIEGKTRAGYA